MPAPGAGLRFDPADFGHGRETQPRLHSGANLNVGGTDEGLLRRAGLMDDRGQRIDPEVERRRDEDESERIAAQPIQPLPPPQHSLAADLRQAIIEAESYRVEQARADTQRLERSRQLARTFEPPALPTADAADKLTTDGAALVEELRKQQVWSRNAMQALAAGLSEQAAAEVRTVQAQLLGPIYELRAQSAMDQAQDRLYGMGVDDPREILGALEQRLRHNPQTYWDLVTNPETLLMGARLIAQERGMPLQTVADGSGFGYSPGTPSSRASAAGDNPLLRKVEESMGIKIRPEYREPAAARIESLLGSGR